MPAAIIPDIMDDGSEAALSCSYPMDEEPASPQQAYFVEGCQTTRESIKRDREREGRCGDCGVQTYELKVDPVTRTQVKTPLNVPGEVHRGRCLFCYPIFPANFFESHSKNNTASEKDSSTISCAKRSCRRPSLGGCSPRRSLGIFNAEAMMRDVLLGMSASASAATPTRKITSRRVSQGSFPMGAYHNPTDPSTQAVLRLLQGCSFDIVDIIAAMKQVPHDRLVQERGCERLWVLSWEDDNSAAIGRVGGVPVILHAMARHPMNAHLQQCACECLQNLAHVNNYNRREICEQQGVKLIVQAMMRHIDCAGIQQCGCTALGSIASGSHDWVREIMSSGGFHAVLLAARQFSEEESVLRAAYDGLMAMGYDPAGRLPPLGLSIVT